MRGNFRLTCAIYTELQVAGTAIHLVQCSFGPMRLRSSYRLSS